MTLGEDDELILNLLVIPELHLHTGIVNKLLSHLNTKWPYVYEWCHRYNIYVQEFRGKTLNGNSCKFALKFLDELEEEVPSEFSNIVTALRAFDAIRKSCLSKKLLPSYNEDIEAFKAAYMALGISITVKAHIIFDHLGYVLDREENGHGLGYYSEQARLAYIYF